MPTDLPQNRTAVIVVEQEVMRRLLCYLLEELGFSVLHLNATGDTEILVPGRPDVILLDARLSTANSYRLCQDLRGRSNLKQTRIIMFGHECTSTERLEGLRAGAHDFISGPFDYGELLAKIEGSGLG